jgi:hypothetical protein
MDRLRELESLRKADRFIADAEMRLMNQIAGFEKERVEAHETALAERTLRAFTNSLKALRQRRDLIANSINGKTPHQQPPQ